MTMYPLQYNRKYVIESHALVFVFFLFIWLSFKQRNSLSLYLWSFAATLWKLTLTAVTVGKVVYPSQQAWMSSGWCNYTSPIWTYNHMYKQIRVLFFGSSEVHLKDWDILHDVWVRSVSGSRQREGAMKHRANVIKGTQGCISSLLITSTFPSLVSFQVPPNEDA